MEKVKTRITLTKKERKKKMMKIEKEVEGEILQEKRAKTTLGKEMIQMKMEKKMILEMKKTQKGQKQKIINQKLMTQF